MNAITIPVELPKNIVAISGETMDRIKALETDAKAITTITDITTFEAANRLVSAANKLAKDIEEERKRLKAPVLALGRSLDDAAGEAIAPLEGIKVDLGKEIMAFQEAENRRRQEEQRKREEAARKAAEEARRTQEEEEAARRAAAESGKELPPCDEPPPDEPAVHVPEVMPPAPVKMLKSSAVTTRTIKRLVIDDPYKIPREINGAVLMLPDEKAIKKLLDAGMQVPGCRLVETETIAAK